MSSEIKGRIRKLIIQKRLEHDKKELTEKSKQVWEKLTATDEFVAANHILFYVAVEGEVETKEMIKSALAMRKKVIVPAADFKTKELRLYEIKSIEELTKKKTGLYEPKNPTNEYNKEFLDLVIVPCIAYDKKGYRIGFGLGFFDRFLKSFRRKIPFIGLAFEFQFVSEIPSEEHDVKMDKIVTEDRICNFERINA